MEIKRNKVKILNISNKRLTETQIKSFKKTISKSTCGIIQDIEIVDLPYSLQCMWKNITPYNFKEICDKIRHYMDKEKIHKAYLKGFTPAIVELTKWSYEFYYTFNDDCNENIFEF